jgi:hypothetical protein
VTLLVGLTIAWWSLMGACNVLGIRYTNDCNRIVHTWLPVAIAIGFMLSWFICGRVLRIIWPQRRVQARDLLYAVGIVVLSVLIGLGALVGSIYLVWLLLLHFYPGGDAIMAVLGIVVWVPIAGYASFALVIWLTFVFNRKLNGSAKPTSE